METNYIREFVVLAETMNFLNASEELFVSQSSLSKHIQALERDLGVSLFNRSTRKVALSEYGRAFLPYAKKISSACQKTVDEILQLKTHGYVNVGSIPSMAQYNITDILFRFQKDNVKFALNMLESDTLELVESLANGGIELAFLREITDENPGLERIPCAVDCLCAVFPQKHPLSHSFEVELTQLQEEELLLLAKDTMLYNLCINKCSDAGFDPNILFSGHRLDNIADYVTKGTGVALLAKGQTRFIRNPKIAVVDIAPRVSMRINLCWKRGAELSLAAKHFIRCAKFCVDDAPFDATGDFIIDGFPEGIEGLVSDFALNAEGRINHE
ncbi:MAG: LysR family transcriptional regulator [Clostridiales bacterium]|jgi:DNA-binding transcriptional LysR family regulator|nr:LysR family transcriptional regulator [Clostridiales bacterium]